MIEKEILNISDLSSLVGRSPRAIRISLHRRKEDLPPSQILAGRRVWLRSDVDFWLKSLRLMDSEGAQA